jgi:hypothetical protein
LGACACAVSFIPCCYAATERRASDWACWRGQPRRGNGRHAVLGRSLGALARGASEGALPAGSVMVGDTQSRASSSSSAAEASVGRKAVFSCLRECTFHSSIPPAAPHPVSNVARAAWQQTQHGKTVCQLAVVQRTAHGAEEGLGARRSSVQSNSCRSCCWPVLVRTRRIGQLAAVGARTVSAGKCCCPKYTPQQPRLWGTLMRGSYRHR